MKVKAKIINLRDVDLLEKLSTKMRHKIACANGNRTHRRRYRRLLQILNEHLIREIESSTKKEKIKC